MATVNEGVVWKATMQLRFVEKCIPISETIAQKVRVLQQYWEPVGSRCIKINDDGSQLYSFEGEWRDVPLEKEEG